MQSGRWFLGVTLCTSPLVFQRIVTCQLFQTRRVPDDKLSSKTCFIVKLCLMIGRLMAQVERESSSTRIWALRTVRNSDGGGQTNHDARITPSPFSVTIFTNIALD